MRAPGAAPEAVAQILAAAARASACDGITGARCADPQSFGQVLEGPREAVVSPVGDRRAERRVSPAGTAALRGAAEAVLALGPAFGDAPEPLRPGLARRRATGG